MIDRQKIDTAKVIVSHLLDGITVRRPVLAVYATGQLAPEAELPVYLSGGPGVLGWNRDQQPDPDISVDGLEIYTHPDATYRDPVLLKLTDVDDRGQTLAHRLDDES